MQVADIEVLADCGESCSRASLSGQAQGLVNSDENGINHKTFDAFVMRRDCTAVVTIPR